MIIILSLFGCGTSTETNVEQNAETDAKQNSQETEVQLKLEDVLLGKWITTEGTADDTARIYNFYESGILDSYIGDLSGTPSTGCYEIENDLIYMNPLERTNPRAYNIVFTVVSFSDTEIVVQKDDKTITWKKYE